MSQDISSVCPAVEGAHRRAETLLPNSVIEHVEDVLQQA